MLDVMETLFYYVGLLTVISLLYSVLSFIHCHFLYRSNLSTKYLRSQQVSKPSSREAKNSIAESGSLPQQGAITEAVEKSWALVTGASDGIGKEFVKEFCRLGFNVILHGRNPSKLEDVRAEVAKSFPKCKTEALILDAAKPMVREIEEAVNGLKHLPITALVNNVGGML